MPQRTQLSTGHTRVMRGKSAPIAGAHPGLMDAKRTAAATSPRMPDSSDAGFPSRSAPPRCRSELTSLAVRLRPQSLRMNSERTITRPGEPAGTRAMVRITAASRAAASRTGSSHLNVVGDAPPLSRNQFQNREFRIETIVKPSPCFILEEFCFLGRAETSFRIENCH